MNGDGDHRIRNEVHLPGGRRVEVTYLDSGERSAASATAAGCEHLAVPPAATAAGAARRAGLHVCQHCGGGLVHPLDWLEDSFERWRVLLRCPDCEHTREGVFGRGLVEGLDDELDRGSGALLSDLQTLTHANMCEEIDLFVRALELDLIGPSDF